MTPSHPIRSKREYEAAQARVAELVANGVKKGTASGDERIQGDAEPRMEASNHGEGQPPSSIEDIGYACAVADEGFQILAGEHALVHLEFDGGNGVRRFYEQLMKALPDLEIDVQRWHVTDDAVLVEVVIRGTHFGEWRGLPATGRGVEFPLCGVYTFDTEDRLAGKKIYYDRATVLRQLGVFREPQSVLGQICIVATHPATMARAFTRKLRHR